MPESPAVNSLRYALNPELVKLYVAIGVGWYIVGFSQEGLFIIPVPFQLLVSLPLFLLGLALVVGGLVAVVHRVLTDTKLSGA
ncbi:hypothetical protein [Haloferax sp. DFSO60]|uniref:hypothetical protein n=1 Tax=Haloferax sp. DFSO60 TaxID=3388652 RepID=UPI00397E0708